MVAKSAVASKGNAKRASRGRSSKPSEEPSEVTTNYENQVLVDQRLADSTQKNLYAPSRGLLSKTAVTSFLFGVVFSLALVAVVMNHGTGQVLATAAAASGLELGYSPSALQPLTTGSGMQVVASTSDSNCTPSDYFNDITAKHADAYVLNEAGTECSDSGYEEVTDEDECSLAGMVMRKKHTELEPSTQAKTRVGVVASQCASPTRVLQSGSWSALPQYCSLQTGDAAGIYQDLTTHYNTHGGAHERTRFTNNEFRKVCRVPGSVADSTTQFASCEVSQNNGTAYINYPCQKDCLTGLMENAQWGSPLYMAKQELVSAETVASMYITCVDKHRGSLSRDDYCTKLPYQAGFVPVR